jgi:hypothetical protein
MTTPQLDELVGAATLRDLFFGEVSHDPTDEITTALRDSSTVRSAIPAAIRGASALTTVAEREVAKATNSLLSTNLADLAAAGWTRYDRLRQAALHTQTPLTPEERVVMATHRVVSSQQPTIDIYIDGRVVATIRVSAGISFKLDGVVAVVRASRLVAIESGKCTVSGTLSIQGVTTAQRERRFDLPGAVRFRNGIPLLADVAAPPPTGLRGVTAAESGPPSANWYTDPTHRYHYRWWNGSGWTSRVATYGRESSDLLLGV